MYDYNKDVKTRDEIIFGSYDPKAYFGGLRYFKGMSGGTLRYLVTNKFTSMQERQNASPTIEELLDFLERHPGYTAHGYAVSIDRGDYRVTVEGLAKKEPEQDRDTLVEFVELNRFADELDISDRMYCWYD